MALDDWNFLAGRLNGDGTIEVVETDLPLTVGTIDRNLSVASSISGTITHDLARLKNAGRPVFDPWSTVLIAEASGLIRGMAIYREPVFNGNVWELNTIGLGGYPVGMPYESIASFTGEDPLNIFRHIWTHLQSFPAGNLGVTVSDLASPVRVGTPEVEGESDSGPRLLNWWSTRDLGATIDELARETPFDWVEKFSWQGDVPHCHIDLGYPTIGARKDLRLVLGENLASEPRISGTEYVNEVRFLGAGEGRDRVTAEYGVTDGRIRRRKTVEDKGITNIEQARVRAKSAFSLTNGQLVVDDLEVFNHTNAPLEAIELGDEIELYAETPWVTLDQYVRVIGKQESPADSDKVLLTIMREVVA